MIFNIGLDLDLDAVPSERSRRSNLNLEVDNSTRNSTDDEIGLGLDLDLDHVVSQQPLFTMNDPASHSLTNSLYFYYHSLHYRWEHGSLE